VANGIAWDAQHRRLFVTGKLASVDRCELEAR
jgi:glutamine cyclotransferase